MSGALAGLAVAITLVIEAGTTPLFGYLSDRTRTRWGRRHPYMFAVAVPLAVSIGLMFSVPAFNSSWATFTYVLVVLIVLRASFSAFALPYAALGAELSDDYDERAVIMSYRNAFNIIGTLTSFVLGFAVFLRGDNGRAAYLAFGWCCALIVLWSTLTSSLRSVNFAPRNDVARSATLASREK
jgi:glycoside/pentoside/hexuronide:cation symporter, GPH family